MNEIFLKNLIKRSVGNHFALLTVQLEWTLDEVIEKEFGVPVHETEKWFRVLAVKDGVKGFITIDGCAYMSGGLVVYKVNGDFKAPIIKIC